MANKNFHKRKKIIMSATFEELKAQRDRLTQELQKKCGCRPILEACERCEKPAPSLKNSLEASRRKVELSKIPSAAGKKKRTKVPASLKSTAPSVMKKKAKAFTLITNDEGAGSTHKKSSREDTIKTLVKFIQYSRGDVDDSKKGVLVYHDYAHFRSITVRGPDLSKLRTEVKKQTPTEWLSNFTA